MMGLIRELRLLVMGAAAQDLGVTGVQLRIEGGEMRGKDPATERRRRDGELFAEPGRVVAADATGIVAWEAVRAGAPQSIGLEQALFAEHAADRTVVTLLREGEPVGMEYILPGADHLAFLLALLLPGGRCGAAGGDYVIAFGDAGAFGAGCANSRVPGDLGACGYCRGRAMLRAGRDR